jgi:hypothetical protein
MRKKVLREAQKFQKNVTLCLDVVGVFGVPGEGSFPQVLNTPRGYLWGLE